VGRQANKERRQRTPAVVALVSEGFGSETNPAVIGSKREDLAGVSNSGEACGLGGISRIRILASALAGVY